MTKVLVAEPVEPLGEVLSALLSVHGHDVRIVRSGREARDACLEEDFDVVLCDYPFPDVGAQELIEEIKGRPHIPSLIVMSAFASTEHVVSLMKLGIDDFIPKPFLPDVIVDRVQLAAQVVRSHGVEVSRQLPQFITQDPSTVAVLEAAQRIAAFDSSVLILGESGTGKEVLAQLIHRQSRRQGGDFIAVNCAAIPDELLESELFGHEEGAFTGAHATRVGVFERASQGTLFLDEIGDMPPGLQVKLLRALQEREIKRVGGSRVIKVTPRIIAATHRCPLEAIKNGTLREDLYYRLAGIELRIPPLRERPLDIDLLVTASLGQLAKKLKKRSRLSEESLRVLRNYHWPGNVRELENVLERAVIFSDHVILPEHLRLGSGTISQHHEYSLSEIAERAAREAEARAIAVALYETKGNKRAAARRLQCSYKTLLIKAKEFGL